ncbi:MAG: FliA/WhiG family RNA polymerase sigma factor [Firmicutes bacterium]|nr:FliA/WhiG family RNA polymerase sigma factor [Bacillota bacterium]
MWEENPYEDRSYTEAEIEAIPTEALLRLYKRTGREELKWPLVLRYIGMVKNIALQLREIYSSFAQVDDVINEGLLALLGAVDKFDPAFGVKFETFASKRVRGSVIDLARKQDWVPRSVRRRARELDQASSQLYSELGRYPTDEEMAVRLEISLEKYQEELANTAPNNILSLDALLEEQEQGLMGFVGVGVEPEKGPADALMGRELVQVLAEGIKTLRENEQLVISLYYQKNLNMKEIAQVLDVSKPRVSQIHARAIQKLKLYLSEYMIENQ